MRGHKSPHFSQMAQLYCIMTEAQGEYVTTQQAKREMRPTIRHPSAYLPAFALGRILCAGAMSYGVHDVFRRAQGKPVSQPTIDLVNRIGDPRGEQTMYLGMVVVREEFRGNGYGSALIDKVIERAKTRGYAFLAYTTENPIVLGAHTRRLDEPRSSVRIAKDLVMHAHEL